MATPLPPDYLYLRATQILLGEQCLAAGEAPRFASTPIVTFTVPGGSYNLYPEDVVELQVTQKNELVVLLCINIMNHHQVREVESVWPGSD
jgi:hypothetical protein